MEGGRSWKAEKLIIGSTYSKFGPCGAKSSLFTGRFTTVRIITLLQNYQLLVIITKPNEMVGPSRRDYPLNDDPPPFLSGLSLRIFLAKEVYMVLAIS